MFFVAVLSLTCAAQTRLVMNLKAGKPQVLVVYGTSLSAGTGGVAWVDSVNCYFNNKYDGKLRVINSGKSAMWSAWGVQHLEDSVVNKQPDAVLMEFSMNDAFLSYHTSVELAELNLNYIIDRLKIANPKCEVILQVMNIPIREHAKARPDLNAYYAMYRRVASKRKLLLIDHFEDWNNILKAGEQEYLKYVPDGIHPDVGSARKIIAPLVIKKLESGH